MESPWRTSDWEHFLARELGQPVAVRFGRSRTVPVEARPGRERIAVRLHGMFATAPADVRDALVRWLRAGRRARRAGALLDAWIERRLAEEPAPPANTPRLEPAGRHHDLVALATPLLASCFADDFDDGRPGPALTWGRRGRSRSRRSLRLGSYDVEAHLVRIHPVLDQRGVPGWFVRSVLAHEILHAVHPPRLGSGRRWIHHGPEFRARERRFPDYERALSWEDRNLDRLIVAARTGRVFVPAESEACQLELFSSPR